MPTQFISDFDLHLLAEGSHFRNWEKLGAHIVKSDAGAGVHFAVWAPNAERVSVIGDFNQWDAKATPMRVRPEAGIWECFVPGIGAGSLYKYRIVSRFNNFQIDKADPYGFGAELRPQTASKVCDLENYSWSDADWIGNRAADAIAAAPRCRFTKCIWVPGCACLRRTTAGLLTTSWPKSWPTTSTRWDTRTSS